MTKKKVFDNSPEGGRRRGQDGRDHQRAAPHQGEVVPHHQVVQEGDQRGRRVQRRE